MDLKHVKGIGIKNIEYLNKADIFSVEDLVTYYPYRYQIISPSNLYETTDTLTINAVVVSVQRPVYLKKNFNILKFQVDLDGKKVNVSIFNRAFLKPHLTIGKEITLIGKYDSRKNIFTASDIKLKKIDGTLIIPMYHSIKNIKNNTLEVLIKNALDSVSLTDNLPLYLQKKYRLVSLEVALEYIHHPNSEEELKEARRRLIFEELFEFMFKIVYLKNLQDLSIGISKDFSMEKVNDIILSLPFHLTNDQQKATNDGLNDLKSNKRMNRLLLGDVGSGKTIVATILVYANFLAGYQTAFLAPTEILAFQHYESIRNILKDTDISIDILVGSMSKKEKENILKKTHEHKIDVLIGTHALLNENLFFDNLGLIITDEQHRFGVNQREALKNKGVSPDMLFMSATPIPRTYALTIYGDMDTSIIKEKPQGRKDIITKVVLEKDLKEVLAKALEEIKKGHQIYVVAPMIDEDETSNLKNVFLLKEKFDLAYHSKIPIGILHGKLKKAEKEEVMNDFKIGRTKILISTTVIEVGVDVKNATMMIIFNSERFGLATLHQLRGRVGRNDWQSYCYLICNYEKKELKVLEESNDGFYISEKDFSFRGEGDLFGTKQSGDMTFKIANIRRDYNILLVAKKEAEDFVFQKVYSNSKHFQKIIEKIDFTN